MSNIKLSVVIPSYNEDVELKKSGIDEIYEYLKKVDYSYEVLIVDDGSTNNTREIVKEYIKGKKGFSLIENEHGGKALTVMSGMLKAEGEIAVFTDMDQATPLKEIEKFFSKFEEGFDIVIGSRSGRKGAPLSRKLSAGGFILIRNILLGLPYKDTQCGFKAFTKKARDTVFLKMEPEWRRKITKVAAVNAIFDIEALFLAQKAGLKTAEIEVNWKHVGSQQVSIVKEAIDAIRGMLRIRINDLQGKYA